MKKRVLIFGIIFVILILNFLSSADITTCQTLDSPNTIYVLQNDVSSTGTCFTISAENVTLDLNGFEVVYGNISSSTGYYGIYSNQDYTKILKGSLRKGKAALGTNYRCGIYFNAVNYGTIENVNITNNLGESPSYPKAWLGIHISSGSQNNLTNINANPNGEGIYLSSSSWNDLTNINSSLNAAVGVELYDSRNNSLSEMILNTNSAYGIEILNSYGNNLTNSTIQGNVNYGVYIYGDAETNLIFNNFLNNTKNFKDETSLTNNLNTTLTSGTNIVGGSYIGGNYWAYPNGTGFSETCTDADSDGICDETYDIQGGIIYDYLPLTDAPTDSTGPTISIIYPTATSYTSMTILNYTASDSSDVDYCWYSLNSGVANSTPTQSCANITGLTAAVGSHTWTVYANDTLGNEGSSSVIFTISSGDEGGDGSSSTSTSSVTTSTVSVTIPINGVTAGSPMTYPIEKEGIDLTKLTIIANQNIQTASFSIKKIDITQEADLFVGFSQEEVYQAFEIDKSGFTNDEIENVTIEFKVEKSWVDNKDASKIILERKENDSSSWGILETNLINEDENYYYFNAISPGFSVFVIYFDEEVCTTGELVCVENKLHLCTSERSLLIVQECEFSCKYGRCLNQIESIKEENILQRVGKLLLRLQDKWGLVVFYLIVAIISVLLIIVFYITFNYFSIKNN